MKRLVQFLRYAVGGLFIFSGLVKANDPLGLAYKMEEFFELWKVYGLISYATALSVIMNALEIISGFALLIGWQNKWNIRLLLGMIVFFTVLTGYTYYTGYPKTCGCFGDCIPITASTSFYKDVILLCAIGFLAVNHVLIGSWLSERNAMILIGFITLLAFGGEFYVLRHLPIIDCLPYKIGTNIPAARKQPPPPPGSTVMFVYEKNGEPVEFSADKFPADFNVKQYRFVRRYDTGEVPQPKIQGLVLFSRTGSDTTDAVLNTDRVILLFSTDIGSRPDEWGNSFDHLIQVADSKKIPVFVITNNLANWKKTWYTKYPNVEVLSCDRTPIRTAARVNPTVYIIEEGTILNKFALRDFSKSKVVADRLPSPN
jgi:hypothetical protein